MDKVAEALEAASASGDRGQALLKACLTVTDAFPREGCFSGLVEQHV
jgi:hypothetical protein